jgi:glutamyl-tRNA reductase
VTEQSLHVCGLSHQSAAIEAREAAALDDAAARAVLRGLRGHGGIDEAAVLSTCNRTELYVVARTGAEARAAARAALLEHTQLDASTLDAHAFALWDAAAAEHLFRVAAGLESAVLGETEISAQVRAAAGRARDEGTLGPLLAAAFRHAHTASRRVRRATAISAGATSLSSVVAQLVADRCGPGRTRIAVLGAGQLAARLAGALAGRGLGDLVILNRTEAAASALAARHGAASGPLDRIGAQLRGADAVIVATQAPQPVIDVAAVRAALLSRERPLVVIDLALPRNVAPDVSGLDSVDLYDLDAIQAIVGRNSDARRREAEAAAELLRGELARFAAWQQQAGAAPLVRELWREAERVRSHELARIGGLTESERLRLDCITRSLVRRLLHAPAQRLREACESPGDRVGPEELHALIRAAVVAVVAPERDAA